VEAGRHIRLIIWEDSGFLPDEHYLSVWFHLVFSFIINFDVTGTEMRLLSDLEVYDSCYPSTFFFDSACPAGGSPSESLSDQSEPE
jgi:hypothetical protein